MRVRVGFAMAILKIEVSDANPSMEVPSNKNQYLNSFTFDK
jgi:hypothetical protein